MATKKTTRKKKPVSKKKPALKNLEKKTAAKKRPFAKKRLAAKKKPVAKKKLAAAKKPAARKQSGVKARKGKQEVTSPIATRGRRGLGPDAGGQSGDTQGLSRREDVDSESVEELLEEGQYMEAEAVSGVENAKDPDEGEVRTKQFPEDDVPEEYKDKD